MESEEIHDADSDAAEDEEVPIGKVSDEGAVKEEGDSKMLEEVRVGVLCQGMRQLAGLAGLAWDVRIPVILPR